MLQRLRLPEPKQWNLSVQIKIWRLGVWYEMFENKILTSQLNSAQEEILER